MRILSYWATLVLISLPSFVSATTFGGYDSKEGKLKNKVIIEAGNAEEVQPPYGVEWNKKLFVINSRCFVFPGYVGYWGYGGKASLLVSDKQGNLELFTFDTSFSSLKTGVESVLLVECPDSANILPRSDDPEEQLRLLEEYGRKQKIKSDAYIKMLENYKKSIEKYRNDLQKSIEQNK